MFCSDVLTALLEYFHVHTELYTVTHTHERTHTHRILYVCMAIVLHVFLHACILTLVKGDPLSSIL